MDIYPGGPGFLRAGQQHLCVDGGSVNDYPAYGLAYRVGLDDDDVKSGTQFIPE